MYSVNEKPLKEVLTDVPLVTDQLTMYELYKSVIFQRLFVDGIQLITKLKSNMKGALMSVSDKLLLRKRAIIETVNDELKNIAQMEHSGHRCFDNFIVNLLGAIAAYCLFPKKPRINVQRTIDTQLTLF